MAIHFTYNADHKERARRLRAEATPEEQAVWRVLRRKQMHGARFHRQRPINQYIVDFYCPKARLVVEIDGVQHFEPDHLEADRLRTEVLESLGLKVLRFSNRDVRTKLLEVSEEIHRVVERRLDSS